MDIDPSSIVLPPGAASQPATGSMDIDPNSIELPEVKEPSILESLGRGAAQGATMGFADEIAGALESAFTKKTYTQARDESRANFDAAKEANPKAYFGGELAGGLAGAVVPGAIAGKAAGALGLGSKALEGAEAVADASKAGSSLGSLALKGATTGAAYGAAQGLGDSTADLTKPGNFHQAIKDTLVGAGTGAIGGAILEPAATKLLEGAPERLTNEIFDSISHGDGTAGSATVTAKKLLAKDKDDILDVLTSDKALAKAVGKPAKEALPVVNDRLNHFGSQLDPNYNVVDGTTGGVSVLNLTDYLTNEAKELAKTPLNESYVKAVDDIRDSILNAYAPDLKVKLARDSKLDAMGLEIPKSLQAQDVMIPTADLRKITTRLQTRGSQVINPLNPGEASIMKADMAKMMKTFLDSHLDVAAENGGEAVQNAVNSIREINTKYSALANIQKAIEQRAWKEATGSTSAAGHLGNLVSHVGLGGAGLLAMHGNIPGAIATAALAHYGPQAAKTITHEGNRLLTQIVTDAAAGKPIAQLTSAAIAHGVPRVVIQRAVSALTGAFTQPTE